MPSSPHFECAHSTLLDQCQSLFQLKAFLLKYRSTIIMEALLMKVIFSYHFSFQIQTRSTCCKLNHIPVNSANWWSNSLKKHHRIFYAIIVSIVVFFWFFVLCLRYFGASCHCQVTFHIACRYMKKLPHSPLVNYRVDFWPGTNEYYLLLYMNKQQKDKRHSFVLSEFSVGIYCNFQLQSQKKSKITANYHKNSVTITI